MSLLQTTGQVTEPDENLLVLKLPDDVRSSGTVKMVARAAIAAFGIAGIIISIATLVSALLHQRAALVLVSGNPAKMEQREGRVDRVGWGRSGEGFIDVRFMLLKGTYEERIFHTVMQRDQWFQVLIGAKRNELGKADDDEAANKPGDIDDGPVTIDNGGGRLAPEEKAAIMMDLRPRQRG